MRELEFEFEYLQVAPEVTSIKSEVPGESIKEEPTSQKRKASPDLDMNENGLLGNQPQFPEVKKPKIVSVSYK